jgi:hypothetical protein
VLEASHPPIEVALHTRRVVDAQLLGQILDQLQRNVQRVGQEHAQVAHRNHLHGEAEPVVVAATHRDQPSILVVQVEEPLHLHPRVRTEPTVTLVHHRDMRSPTQRNTAHQRVDPPNDADTATGLTSDPPLASIRGLAGW